MDSGSRHFTVECQGAPEGTPVFLLHGTPGSVRYEHSVAEDRNMTVAPAKDPHSPRARPGSAERWRVIGSALDSWPRTFRLCLILVATQLPLAVVYLSWLLHHA
jgi:hypothetical protein